MQCILLIPFVDVVVMCRYYLHACPYLRHKDLSVLMQGGAKDRALWAELDADGVGKCGLRVRIRLAVAVSIAGFFLIHSLAAWCIECAAAAFCARCDASTVGRAFAFWVIAFCQSAHVADCLRPFHAMVW